MTKNNGYSKNKEMITFISLKQAQHHYDHILLTNLIFCHQLICNGNIALMLYFGEHSFVDIVSIICSVFMCLLLKCIEPLLRYILGKKDLRTCGHKLCSRRRLSCIRKPSKVHSKYHVFILVFFSSNTHQLRQIEHYR